MSGGGQLGLRAGCAGCQLAVPEAQLPRHAQRGRCAARGLLERRRGVCAA